jgi:hypothetical protein
MANNLKLIRFINGEEVLAEHIEFGYDAQLRNNSGYDAPDYITIKNPVRIVLVPSKTNVQTPSIAFAPWAEFTAEKELTIRLSSVVYIADPINEFKNQYNSMFGGIVAPSSKLIIPGA